MTGGRENPGLRRRTFLIGSTAWIAFVAILLSVSLWIVHRGFREVEEREFAELAGRTRDLLDSHLDQLAWKGRDWAEWDAADAWIRGSANGFAEENLNDSALAILGESALAYFRRDGTPVAVLGFDLQSRSARSPDTGCLRAAIPGNGIEPRLGLVRCGEDLLAISATAVRNSLGIGDVSGWFVIAHEMDSSKFAELGGLLGHRLHVQADSAETDKIRLGDSVAVLDVSYPLLGGSGGVRVEVQVGRPVRRVAARLTTLLVWAMVSMAAAGTLLSLWILEIFVVRRILRLSKEVVAFSDGERTAPTRFGDGGPDEIGALGNAIDGLVGRLVAALDAAEAGARAKGAFLASVSHDLRTPLNGMIGLNDVLLKTSLDEPQRESMALLRSASETLLAMINDILEYSRTEAGHAELQVEDARTEDVFFQPIRVLAPIAHHQGIELLLKLDPELPDAIRVDASRFRQILHNLVGNALKFTERGEVVLEVRMVRQDAEVVGLRVAVEDTGTGIPEECLESIFLPFQQASPEIGKRQGGTGLGLSISRQIVEQMGGRLEVSSTVGRGSRFEFEIAVPKAAQARRLVPLVFPWTTAANVVVVVSNPALRDVLLDLLARLRLATRVLDDLEALEFEEAASALVIADVESLGRGELPGLDRLRSIEGMLETPVVVLSRTDRLHDEELCRRRGVASVLRGPFPPSLIVEAIEASLRPVIRVLLPVHNRFLRSMVASVLENRGHHVFVEGLEAGEPEAKFDVCVLDGEAATFPQDLQSASTRGFRSAVVQLGGVRTEGPTRFLDRPFTPELLREAVESAYRVHR